MFTEYSMTDMGALAEYFGFTDDEVRELCDRYDMDFEEARAWYNGYKLVSHSKYGVKKYAMYSPKSVVEAMLKHKFGTYWNQTETYEALKVYIQMNMDGLKDAVIKMLAGESEKINTGTFENDMTSFATKDDVLTLLVHLGYRHMIVRRKRFQFQIERCQRNILMQLVQWIGMKYQNQ